MKRKKSGNWILPTWGGLTMISLLFCYLFFELAKAATCGPDIPDGYTVMGDSGSRRFYKIHSLPKRSTYWAEEDCAKDGAHLFMPKSEEDHAFIVDKLVCLTTEGQPCVFPMDYGGNTYNHCTDVDYNIFWCATKHKEGTHEYETWGYCPDSVACNGDLDDPHIGLINPNFSGTSLQWIDGTPVAKESLISNIYGHTARFCVYVRQDGNYYFSNCYTARPYICQLDCDDINEHPSSCDNGVALPAGYRVLNGIFYKDHPPAQMYTAYKTCRDEGATLVTFKTEEEYKKMKQLMAYRYKGMWTDLLNPTNCDNALNCSSELTWLDGTNYLQEDWAAGLDSLHGYDCFRVSGSYKAFNRRCSSSVGYVCVSTCRGVQPPACPNGETVPDDYHEFRGKFYRHLDNSDTFLKKVTECSKDSARLQDFRTELAYENLVLLSTGRSACPPDHTLGPGDKFELSNKERRAECHVTFKRGKGCNYLTCDCTSVSMANRYSDLYFTNVGSGKRFTVRELMHQTSSHLDLPQIVTSDLQFTFKSINGQLSTYSCEVVCLKDDAAN